MDIENKEFNPPHEREVNEYRNGKWEKVILSEEIHAMHKRQCEKH